MGVSLSASNCAYPKESSRKAGALPGFCPRMLDRFTCSGKSAFYNVFAKHNRY